MERMEATGILPRRHLRRAEGVTVAAETIITTIMGWKTAPPTVVEILPPFLSAQEPPFHLEKAWTETNSKGLLLRFGHRGRTLVHFNPGNGIDPAVLRLCPQSKNEDKGERR